MATALTGPLAWEPPYAEGVALKDKRWKKKDLNCQTHTERETQTQTHTQTHTHTHTHTRWNGV